MTCNRSREWLALYVSGDLAAKQVDALLLHLEHCANCQAFHARLDRNHSLVRSLRQEVVPSAALAEMRQSLFARLEEGGSKRGWHIRLERFLFGELRRPRYAILGIVLIAVVSATLFAQLRHASANLDSAAGLLGESNQLRLPEDFREWTLIGTSNQFAHSGSGNALQNVYLNPQGYREYRRTGLFPEGAVLVLESSGVLAASVKDRRFAEGWGYFQFIDGNGQKTKDAPPLAETAQCLTCHRDRGATDHVFIQFYPVLRSASGVL